MIRILDPGLLTTVQDGGRYGYQRFGVPVCGAMDAQALAMANLLVGNKPDEGALEITALGPTIRFETENIFALAGADFSQRATAFRSRPDTPGWHIRGIFWNAAPQRAVFADISLFPGG